MPTVRRSGQMPQSGYHSDSQIERVQKPAKARDELVGAFAGKENEENSASRHSTNVKSRKTEKSKQRTPIR